MPLFLVETRDRLGHSSERRVVAQTREAALRRLSARDVYLVGARKVAPSGRSRPYPSVLDTLRPVPMDLRADLLRHLQELLSVGMPLGEVLERVSHRTPDPRLRRLCREGMEAARSGARLSEILAANPGCLAPWVAASLSAAEQAGTVDALLPLLVEDHREASRERARLIYPTVTAKAVVGFALVATTLPVAISHGLAFWAVNTLANGVPLLLLALLAWHAVRFAGRIGPVCQLLERLASWLPVIGVGRRVIYARRFLRGYRAMVRSGHLPQEAMEAAASSAGPAWLEVRGQRAAEHLRRGGDLATALRMAGVLDTRVSGLLETAEETGETDAVLDECVAMLDDEAERESLRRSIWSWALLFALAAVIATGALVVGFRGYYAQLMDLTDAYFTD